MSPGDLYLDVGCGYGRITHQLEKRGAKTAGIDLNFKELRLGHQSSPNVLFVQAYGEQIPFQNEQFDGAVMLGVLGAVGIEARRKIFAATVKTLKPGGLLYVAEFAMIYDPAVTTRLDNVPWTDVYRRDNQVTGEYGSVVVHNNDGSTHFVGHHFTYDEFLFLFRGAGVAPIASERVAVQSNVSGATRDTWTMWGHKAR
ncbi:MAG: class I SAM-dependent methyltransferase [Candidatus Levybacteria bacterium]|nr:class I SAM-dependent methyltransferase [Candidatus Levybacteria bacterium]